MRLGGKETLASSLIPAVPVMAAMKMLSLPVSPQDGSMPAPRKRHAPPLAHRVETGTVGGGLPPLTLARRPVTRKAAGRRDGLRPTGRLDSALKPTGVSIFPANEPATAIIIPIEDVLTKAVPAVPAEVIARAS